MKICIIRQPAGLGDIFFTLKIAKKILDNNLCNKVYWPVIPEFTYISEYIKYPGLFFCSENDIFPYKDVYLKDNREIINTNELLYIPLQHADKMNADLILKTKYNIIQAKWENWDKFLNIERNIERENYLFYNILNLTNTDTYNIVSAQYGSPPHSKKLNIQLEDNNRKTIEVKYIKDITVFDWCRVFENATTIHLVDTCFTYLCEVLELKATNMTLYSRTLKPYPPSYTQTQFLWKKNWNYKQL